MIDENENIRVQKNAEDIETMAESLPEQMESANTQQPEAEQEEAAEAQEKAHKKGGAGKHVQKLEAALEAAEKERDDFRDKYLRTFSDFNNYKKRSLTAAAAAGRDGQAEAIVRILPVLDNFERALESMNEQQGDAFVKGMFMVYRQFSDALAAFGLKEINAEGEAFDPNLHQAISAEDAAEGREPGVVTNVLQKGYTLGDKVLRHSMVTVSK